jgi:hypothetical protein
MLEDSETMIAVQLPNRELSGPEIAKLGRDAQVF